jgi:hypothetical protein
VSSRLSRARRRSASAAGRARDSRAAGARHPTAWLVAASSRARHTGATTPDPHTSPALRRTGYSPGALVDRATSAQLLEDCVEHRQPTAPDNSPPRISVPPTQPGTFAHLGIGVPGFVISPYSKKDYVRHVVHDHTSILKFIETKFNIGAMTYRDANADNLLDSLDFTRLSFREPPSLAEPNRDGPTEALPAEMNFARPIRFAESGLPAGGSACEPQPRPAVNPIPGDAVPYRKVEV